MCFPNHHAESLERVTGLMSGAARHRGAEQRRAHVVITNTSLRNGGDAAIVEAMELIIRESLGDGTRFSYEDIDPTSAREIRPERDIHPYPASGDWRDRPRIERRIRRALRAAAVAGMLALPSRISALVSRRWRPVRHRVGADLIVSAGGTYLVSEYPVSAKLANLGLAERSGQTTVLFTQSIGFMGDRLNRAFLRHVLTRADLILVRDERSAQNLTAMRVPPSRTVMAHDAAFALAGPDVWESRSPAAGRPLVGISVRDCRLFQPDADHEESFRDRVAQLCDWLVETRGCDVLFVSTCQGVAGYGFDDSSVALDILGRMQAHPEGRVVVDTEHHQPAEFRSILSTMTLVIAVRLHAAIQSLTVGTAVIPIAYEPKSIDLWSSFDLDDYLLRLGDRLDVMIATVDRALSDPDAYRRRLARAQQTAYDSAWSTAALLREAVAS